MKRQLIDKEKELNSKAIERLKKEIEVGKDYLELYKLTHDKILKRNYEQLVEKYKNLIRDTEGMIDVSEQTIIELEKQNSEGVEVKEIKKEKK